MDGGLTSKAAVISRCSWHMAWCSASAAAALLSAADSWASVQGLTLVHFSAQPEPFILQNTP
jgi:hypothetical protein